MAQNPIEIDPTENDGDSTIEERLSTYTASLTSSVIDYPIEHGRRYHAYRPGAYALPNDEPEMDRLDLTHAMMIKSLRGKRYLAPIDTSKTHRILDIGTGTGIWAIEVADMLPGAEVLGNDLSAIQPRWLPPNVKFEVDDVESPWSYPSPFDFIFCRYMFACISDWPKLVGNIYDNLRLGGWAEFQDYDLMYYSEDGSLTEESATRKWLETLLPLADEIGREPCPGPKLEEWARGAGFKGVRSQRYKLPLGPWPKDPPLKEIGMFNLRQVLDGLEGFSLRLLCDVAGWAEDEVHVLLTQVRQELKNPAIHMQYDFYVVYGQKE